MHGDPLNIILSGASNVAMSDLITALGNVSPADGNNAWQSVGILPAGCINRLLADTDPSSLPPVSDYIQQDASAREGGCVTILNSGIDHFRAWQQGASGAWFIAASTEQPCVAGVGVNHCVISYQDGRTELVTDIASAAQANGWQMTTESVAAYDSGDTPQPNGNDPTYDGNVTIVTLTH